MFTPKTILIAAVSVMLVFSACNNKGKNNDNGYSSTTPTTCSCEPNWFPHLTTPPPLEGKGSPFDTSSTSNCIFHQWSVQKFLWLTRPMQSGHAFFQDSLIQVNAQLDTILPQHAVPLVLEDTGQAGSHGSLHTNPALSSSQKSSMVYYSIFANSTLLNAATYFKAFIGNDPTKLTNDSMFPVGSLELKISWVNVEAIPQAELPSYYTTVAVIKTGSSYKPAKVALLGMHVVGRVINHPEFIWATFEHHDMAPYYNWAGTTNTQDAPIASANDKLLFAKGTTSTLAGITWNFTTNRIDSLYRVYSLYKYGVPRVALDSFMSGTSQVGSVNYANVESLNQCMAASLGSADVWSNYFYNGSIWINTDGKNPQQQASLIDSLGNNIGNTYTGSFARGSLNIFNVTMETYVQTNIATETNRIHTITADSLFNCMGCHTGAPNSIIFGPDTLNNPVSPLFVSHLFRNFISRTAKSTEHDAQLQGVRDFLLKRMSKEKIKQLKLDK